MLTSDVDFDTDDRVNEIHRDDHYTFMVLETGRVEMMIDFEAQEILPGSAFMVAPGQVHQLLNMESSTGWIISMDAAVISDICLPVFQSRDTYTPLVLCDEQLSPLRDCARLLNTLHRQQVSTALHGQTVRQLASAYAAMMATAYNDNVMVPERALSRYGAITQSFRRLLAQHYKDDKTPSGYADRLHLSVNYLNEAVRTETGMPVRYWIQHTVMLEAKRLLYYTPLSVKEIAHALGFEDHAYFTRLFTKVNGASPLVFRRRQQGGPALMAP